MTIGKAQPNKTVPTPAAGERPSLTGDVLAPLTHNDDFSFVDVRYLRQADPQEANKEFQTLLPKHPGNPYILYEYMVFLTTTRRSEEAFKVGESILTILEHNVRQGRALGSDHSQNLSQIKKRTRARVMSLKRQLEEDKIRTERESNPPDVRRELYAEYDVRIKYIVASYVGKNSLMPKLGSFGFEELVDAGKEGLFEATAFWDSARGVPFMGYATFFIMGRIRERKNELLRQIPSSDYEFSEDRPNDGGRSEKQRLRPEDMADESWRHIESEMTVLKESGRMRLAVTTLQEMKLLSPAEERIARAIMDNGFDVDGLSRELGLGPTDVKITSVKLIRKMRSYLRNDDLFDASVTRLPAESISNLKPIALSRVRSALHYLRNGADLVTRPLLEFSNFLPDLSLLANAIGLSEPENIRSQAGRVISIYRHAAGLTVDEVSRSTGQSSASLFQLSSAGKLNSREAPVSISALANALSIDPTQILFRAMPELASLFDRVVSAGNNVYVAIIESDIAPETVMKYIGRPEEATKAHTFVPVARAYRLAAGEASMNECDPRYSDLEGGKGVARENIAQLAEMFGMPKLMMLLGTWPELAALFDIVDENGKVLHQSTSEYSRLVILIKKKVHELRKDVVTPNTPGLVAFIKSVVSGKPESLTPEALEGLGLSQRIISGLISGIPPQLKYLEAIAKALTMNPLETTRFIAEVILATSNSERTGDLHAVIVMTQQEAVRRNAILRFGSGLAEAVQMDDIYYQQLNNGFFAYFSGKKRGDAYDTGINGFIDAVQMFMQTGTLPKTIFGRKPIAGLEELHSFGLSTCVEMAQELSLSGNPFTKFIGRAATGGIVFGLGMALSDLVTLDIERLHRMSIGSVTKDFTLLSLGGGTGRLAVDSLLRSPAIKASPEFLKGMLARGVPLFTALSALELGENGRLDVTNMPLSMANIATASGITRSLLSGMSKNRIGLKILTGARLLTTAGKTTFYGAVAASAIEFTVLKFMGKVEAALAEGRIVATLHGELQKVLTRDAILLSKWSETGEVDRAEALRVEKSIAAYKEALDRLRHSAENDVKSRYAKERQELDTFCAARLREQKKWSRGWHDSMRAREKELAELAISEGSDLIAAKAQDVETYQTLPLTPLMDEECQIVDHDDTTVCADIANYEFGNDIDTLYAQIAAYSHDRNYAIAKIIEDRMLAERS